ncbi:NTP transferase domain-containing protein [Deinococcus peraridilitoris]|uniref:Uncharacterized protein n=1 Tax=Deinococcus peraridilitoris (strain DSM 19664 / LMG 22246 / CIP 109416 / KR-200) TaxID=937777 RepID=K9ZZ72_DEIPD|nr:NTP transferase domain-containing protein [Deinococcus peraridilitoris]AFZ66499.1 hypothetical protein Deipe_0931 [Deinococcus peraridilitoris DSM 19664]
MSETSGPVTVVVTMAGRGSRFREAGFEEPKYAIRVHERTLFDWSMTSLLQFARRGERFVFIALSEHKVGGFVRSAAARLDLGEVEVVEIDGVTDGQATTVLAAREHIGPDDRMLVYNIDTFIDPVAVRPEEFSQPGWIPCFPGEGDGWSFARTDEHLRVLEVREKQRISPHASVGLYGFSSFGLYQAAYEAYYADPSRLERGEKYIAPMYNQLLAWNEPVSVSVIPAHAVYPLGTPQEVNAFAGRLPPRLEL